MKDPLFFKERSILSFLIFLKPIQTAPIRQMFYPEMFKCSLEAITGVLSCNQQLRIIVYSLSSNE